MFLQPILMLRLSVCVVDAPLCDPCAASHINIKSDGSMPTRFASLFTASDYIQLPDTVAVERIGTISNISFWHLEFGLTLGGFGPLILLSCKCPYNSPQLTSPTPSSPALCPLGYRL